MTTITLRHRRQRAAEERMERAKKAFSHAAAAALYGDKTAADKAKVALAEVNAARADLAALARLSAGPDE